MNRNLLSHRALTAGLKLFVWTSLTYPAIAHAYVDPGSGSVIVTAILGFIGAIGYTFRKYFYKLKNVFARKDPNSK